jgi:alpha-galactosidase
MPRITFVGAGSTVFTRHLIGDVLAQPELAGSTFALMDIDPARLEASRKAAEELVAAHRADAAVEATLERREALDGADYVVTCFQVGGLESTLVDFEIPKRYGLRQTIGDTLGVGGISRALRTVPVLLDVCRDIEELCPDALLLQYVNPMAMLCWAVAERSPVRTVGLCHSVQHTTGELAADLGIPPSEIDAHVAGINHLAFFLRLERDGEDLYPALREVEPPDGNRVRYEVLRHFGAFVTESSEHFAEYVPWFIKADRPELIERFGIPLDEYVRRLREAHHAWEEPIEVGRSHEYGADIIRACETGEPFRFNGNVRNRTAASGELPLISNLPEACCVEVPCIADARGITPEPVGALPAHLAALMQTNVNVQALAVEAALTGSRDAAKRAAMLDPHTAAELALDEIAALMDELIDCHSERHDLRPR